MESGLVDLLLSYSFKDVWKTLEVSHGKFIICCISRIKLYFYVQFALSVRDTICSGWAFIEANVCPVSLWDSRLSSTVNKFTLLNIRKVDPLKLKVICSTLEATFLSNNMS